MPAKDKNSKKHGGMTRDAARDFFEANQIKFVLAQFVDIHGVAKTKAVPVEHFEDVILEDGAGFAGFALWGMGQEPHDPDYLAIGDLATLTLVPWQPGYARIVCDGRIKGKPWPFDSRFILKEQVRRLTRPDPRRSRSNAPPPRRC
jgi:glutamine synthetase